MCLLLNWKQTARNEWADYTEECLEQFREDRRLLCVYLIWSVPENRMVYVGSGEVDRLWDHLHESDPQYGNIHRHSGLKATYALISGPDMRGAEGFLALGYEPAEGDKHPREFVKVTRPKNGVYFDNLLDDDSIDMLGHKYNLYIAHRLSH